MTHHCLHPWLTTWLIRSLDSREMMGLGSSIRAKAVNGGGSGDENEDNDDDDDRMWLSTEVLEAAIFTDRRGR